MTPSCCAPSQICTRFSNTEVPTLANVVCRTGLHLVNNLQRSSRGIRRFDEGAANHQIISARGNGLARRGHPALIAQGSSRWPNTGSDHEKARRLYNGPYDTHLAWRSNHSIHSGVRCQQRKTFDQLCWRCGPSHFSEGHWVRAGQNCDADDRRPVEPFGLSRLSNSYGGASHHFSTSRCMHIKDGYAQTRSLNASGSDGIRNVVKLEIEKDSLS